MDTVSTVLEIQTRSLNHYHKLEKFPVRIGRALDNDIILSDSTVSAHHLEIDREEDGSLLVRNLSEEKGSRINSHSFQEERVQLAAGQEPIHLRLGNRRARLMRSDMEVCKTSVRNCTGPFVLFCRLGWSIALVLIMLFAFLYESYLQTMFSKELIYYISGVMPYLMGMIALTLLAAGISRLSIQRWEVGAATSLAALFMLVPHLLGEVGHFLNYLFTADWPLEWLLLMSNFLLLPILLYAYIRLVHHAETWSAIGIALLFSSPLLVYQATDLADQFTVANEFSGDAKFNRTLSSWDIRLQPTVSIDKFAADVRHALPAAASD